MRRLFTHMMAAAALLLAAPVVAHAQAPLAPSEMTPRINSNLVKELAKAKAVPAEPAAVKAAAQALITTAGASCAVTEAASRGEGQITADKVKGLAKAYEVSCDNSLGYIVTQHAAAAPIATDCIVVATMDPAIACKLAGNAESYKRLQPLLVSAKSGCVAADARYIGENAKSEMFEIKCANNTGQILQAPKPRKADSRYIAASCASIAVAGKPFPCTLTTEEANTAPIRALAGKSTPPCTSTKNRYMVGLADGSDYFEFACDGGKGIVIQASSSGEYIRTVDCARAAAIAGGCTLTDASASIASLQSELTGKLTAAGLKCDVAKVAALPTKPDGTEATEFSCKGAPGGVVLVKAEKTSIFNCGRSQAEGYACAMTTKDQAYSDLTTQLKANGKMTCTVNGVSPRASVTTAWLEVSCSDGNPGWMIKYARDSNTPDEVLTCKQFTERGAGSCSLPTNKRDAA